MSDGRLKPMNFSMVRDRYNQASKAGYDDLSDPHEMISLTMRELHRSLEILTLDPAPARELRNKHMTRALTAIYILQTSLDMDRGGAIAENLFQVYEYCRQQLVERSKDDGMEKIAKGRDLIATILEAWDEIKRQQD
jgi:flagellar secretion chaperone FliS